jgi:hypothetical protein
MTNIAVPMTFACGGMPRVAEVEIAVATATEGGYNKMAAGQSARRQSNLGQT